MNIVYITKKPYPYGGASTNRILTYTPGLVAKGHTITILCLILSNKENARLLNENASCDFQGVLIRYMCGRKMWPSGRFSRFLKALILLKAYFATFSYLRANRKQIDIVQMIDVEVNFMDQVSRWCRRLGLKYVIERSELPDIVRKKDVILKTKGEKYIRKAKRVFGQFDGWILETQTLVDYYSQFFSPQAKYVIVPMTVDVKRFAIEKTESKYGDYIAYCGGLVEDDGISILIKAFAIVKRSFPKIKLVLAGNSNDVPSYKLLSKTLGLIDDVLFVGRVSRDDVPQLLTNAMVLALASPTSDRACATMPCKVGEYLCTSNPVVVTGLGEINKYLKDGESAFLSEPDSVEAFAEKLMLVLSDITVARAIGKKGQDVAIENFSSEAQVERIESFYKELIS